MAQVIASTYEIIREIGSGGGGVVYLARHSRLDKLVVLKADKREISTKESVLRREVDAMKNLSHSYIPQVYDYVLEGETVYTVMDYVEGESFDKLLERGCRFPQRQVIEWACQLLSAVGYLHSRPPHGILHSDIKPANVMLTPENDIRLIDFNIALALGEKGAVRVGFSRGYASPEHYGTEYRGIASTGMNMEDVETQTSPVPVETELSARMDCRRTTGPPRKRTVLLDVRSDIYSLGATLYHILTGQRPSPDATSVAPISSPDVSPLVAAIVKKAMAPNPDDRYQTAEEMLKAFEYLHENDPRAKRYRRIRRITACIVVSAFLLGGLCAFGGLKQMEREQREAKLAAEAAEHTERTSRMALSAIEQGREALRAGNTPEAIRCGLEAMELNADYSAQGQLLLSDALGIYDLFDGFKAYRQLQLDSQPMKVVLSPQGTRIAAATIENALVFDTDSGDELARLRSEHSALSDIAFLGEDMLLFAGTDGLCAYNLAQGEKAWTAGPATGITVSMDGATVAAVYKNENIATIYDAATGTAKYAVAFENDYQSKVENDVFADPENNLLALDDHGTKFAASFADGSLRVFDLADSANDLIIYDTSEFTHFEGGFFDKYLAFSAAGKECSVFAIIDTMEGRQTGGFASTMPFYVQTDKNGIYVSTENILVQIDPETGEQREVAYTDADIIKFQVGASHTIVTTTDQSFSIYDAAARLVEKYSDGIQRDFTQIAGSYAAVASLDAPTVQLLKLKEHEDSQLFSYAPDYQHSEARLSSDMQTVMLFRYDKFRLYDMNGNVLADVELPDAKEVYDQQYRRSAEGDYLEVTYNDGTIRSYSAEDGRLTCEEAGNAHDGSFEEEFLTEHLRVISPLHGTPLAYDRASGELICELEKDDYLTYVTEVEEYVITEYLTAQGERYGLLLNRQCETLARLPGLCDILADGTLVFDNMAGDLRQSRIYSKQELIALAQNEEG